MSDKRLDIVYLEASSIYVWVKRRAKMNNILSQNLKNLRHTKKYTQAEVAEVLGVMPQTISRWETGVALPDVLLLPEIAKLYCVTVDDLYKEQSFAYSNYAQRLAAIYEDSRKLEDFVRADLEFQKIINSGNFDTDDLRGYGIIYQYLMDACKEKAISLFDEVIAKGIEENELVYFQTKQQRAYLFSQIGEENKVIDEQLAITSKRNFHVKEWVVLVAAACYAGKKEEAYAYFQKAVETGVEQAELYCYGGDVCCELEKIEEAFSYWNKAIELDESVMAAKYSKGFCYEKLGEYDKAKAVWSDIVEQLERMGLDIEIKRVKEHLRMCESQMR